MALDLWKKFLAIGSYGSPEAIAAAQDADENQRRKEFQQSYLTSTAQDRAEASGDFRHVPLGSPENFHIK